MSRTLKSLPMIQNWDCHACGNCCTDYVVPVSAADRKRIEAQGWRQRPEFKDVPLFVRSTPWWQFWKKRYRLNQGKGHACIFLDEKKLCRIHAEFGFETKPFACRLYPYILIPAGDQWRIGMRYACPSAAANKGRALTERTAELDAFAAEMEEWDTEDRNRATPGTHRPPPLGGGQRLGWKDLEAVVDAWIAFLRDRADPFPRRMLRCLAFLRLAQALRLDNLSGARLRETIGMLLAAAGAEVPRDLGTMPKPGWIGRVLFRTTAALYLRKDSGTRIGVARRGRLALMAAMARMVRGAGKLPRLQQGLPEATFAELESQPLGDLSPQTAEVLERYYEVKLSSFQFCGPICYDLSVWDGFATLALTLPVILWLARGYRERGQTEAVLKAVTVIDEHFGYNPMLGSLRQRFSTRILTQHGELDRLIAWYGQ